MQKTIQHPKLGEITYIESPWSGKSCILVNGILAKRVSRTQFYAGNTPIFVRGNILSKINLIIEGELFPVVPKPRWYDYLLACYPTLIFWAMWTYDAFVAFIFPMIPPLACFSTAYVGVFTLLRLRGKSSLRSKIILSLWALFVSVLIAVAEDLFFILPFLL